METLNDLDRNTILKHRRDRFLCLIDIGLVNETAALYVHPYRVAGTMIHHSPDAHIPKELMHLIILF